MARMFTIPCPVTGDPVLAVREGDYLVTAARPRVGQPAHRIHSPIVPKVGTSTAPVAPTAAGKVRQLVTPAADDLVKIVADLEIDAAKSLADVGRHPEVLRFYAQRIRDAGVKLYGQLADAQDARRAADAIAANAPARPSTRKPAKRKPAKGRAR